MAAHDAELHMLSTQVEQSRQELGETVAALRDKMVPDSSVRNWARHQAGEVRQRARRAAWSAARSAAYRPVAAAKRIRTRTARELRDAGYARVAAMGVSAGLLAAVLAWRAARHGNLRASRR
jgi:hypothetical protein